MRAVSKMKTVSFGGNVAIKELSEEQVRDWTLKQKDEWWLKNVYRGDMPQLNIRSATTGVMLGSILSFTNLYVGIKTGWTLGVGISSVVLSFAIFKLISKLNIGTEMTILENNAMQSIATSAGYMTAPMMASIPAYMMVTGQVIPMHQVIVWIILLSLLGVLFAFPLKKRFINDDQLKFPEGYAAGVVLDSLHTTQGGKEGIFKAKLLLGGAGLSAFLEIWRSHSVLEKIGLGKIALMEYWDDIIYKLGYMPNILGSPLNKLTIQWETSIVMMGTGGLMNMKTAMSLLLGAFINYFILAPIMIQNGVILEVKFKAIAMWSMWGGAAIMTTSSLYSFFSKPEILISAFTRLFKKKDASQKDILEHIELPMRLFVVGIPIVSLVTVYLGHEWFGIHWVLGLIAVPLVFIFTLIAVTSTGLTSITPGGTLGKLTQITYAFLAPKDVSTNLMTAGITSEVSLNASNLLMDIKPAYMLGGKPRHQALGHVIGVIFGSIVAVPAFYMIFNGDINQFGSDKMPLPGAIVWKGVSEFLTTALSEQGWGALHITSRYMIVIGAVLGIVLEILNKKTKGKFPISGVGLGLGVVLQFFNAWSMALGTLFFWLAKKKCTNKDGFGYRAFVENQETVAAGVIAGGSLIGIILMILDNFM
jgi:putative OPT family oligopeptide transporter